MVRRLSSLDWILFVVHELFLMHCQRNSVIDFEKDASRLNKFPLLRVDPRLKPILSEVTRSSYVVAFIPLLAARIMEEDGEGRQELLQPGVVRSELSDVLASMKSGYTKSQSEGDNVHLALSEDVNLLVMVIRWLVCELDRHRDSLGDVQFGICGSRT